MQIYQSFQVEREWIGCNMRMMEMSHMGIELSMKQIRKIL